MPLDPNIILQGQAPVIANPLDLATKAMNYQDLALKNQALQKSASDQKSMSDILRANMTTDDNGRPVLDKQAALKDLYAYNPTKAMETQKEWAANDLETLKSQADLKKQLAMQMDDEPSYLAARAKGIQLGLPGADKLPEQYPGPQYVNQIQFHTLNENDRLTQLMKDREFAQKDEELGIKHEENDLKRDQLNSDKHEKYVQHVEDNEKSFRGDPAATAAASKLAAVTSGKAIIDRYRGHEDDMPMQDIASLTGDRIKAVTGAAPTKEEIDQQMPHTGSTTLAGIKSWLSGSPQPANAGEFVKNIDAGFRDMEDANRPLLANRQETIASNPKLTPAEKQRMIGTAVPPKIYTDKKQAATPAPIPAISHPEAKTAMQWAADPNSPGWTKEKAQAIMQRLGQ